MNSSKCLRCFKYQKLSELLSSQKGLNTSRHLTSLHSKLFSHSSCERPQQIHFPFKQRFFTPSSQSFNKVSNSFYSTESHAYDDKDDKGLKIDNQEQTNDESSEQLRRGVLSLDDIYNHIIDENGSNVVVIELPKHVNYVDFFIVVTAYSSRHLVHLAESLNRLYKQRKSEDDPFCMIEGKKTSKDWQCVDFGNAVVHFMLEPVREKYQLERLWLFGPKYDDLIHETPSIKELLHQQSSDELFLLSDKPNSSEFIEEFDVVNPWEIEYDADEKALEKWDDDEDAYLI